jgi:hypothetical protein
MFGDGFGVSERLLHEFMFGELCIINFAAPLSNFFTSFKQVIFTFFKLLFLLLRIIDLFTNAPTNIKLLLEIHNDVSLIAYLLK